MPEYDFVGPNGEEVVAFFPVSDRPALGETVEIDGVPCTRVASPLQGCVVADRHFVSHSLPRNHPDAAKKDTQGRPVFTSRRDVREFCSRAQDRPGGGFDYDS